LLLLANVPKLVGELRLLTGEFRGAPAKLLLAFARSGTRIRPTSRRVSIFDPFKLLHCQREIATARRARRRSKLDSLDLTSLADHDY